MQDGSLCIVRSPESADRRYRGACVHCSALQKTCSLAATKKKKIQSTLSIRIPPRKGKVKTRPIILSDDEIEEFEEEKDEEKEEENRREF